MTTSMNDNEAQKSENDNTPSVNTNGALADGLTLIRAILTPLIMFVIVKAWSAKPDDPMGFVSLDLSLVLLASILFVIAALTDIFDDVIGGSENSKSRLFGWFDDIADSILIGGTLIALMWVTYKAGLLHWTFAVPAIAWMSVGISANFISKGVNETRLDHIKSALAMFATCTLVASPWLANFVDSLRAGSSGDQVLSIYDNASPLVWNIGIAILWVAAILSLFACFKSSRAKKENEDTLVL